MTKGKRRAARGPHSPAIPAVWSDQPCRYWVLKQVTTDEREFGRQFWQEFLSESVIAIGWKRIRVDPSAVSQTELEAEVQRAYPHDKPITAKRGAKKLKWFVEMGEGDLAIICDSFAANGPALVHLFGVARVTGPFFEDAASSWWRFKHPAEIQVIDRNIPRNILADALNKQSQREAIHEVEPGRFPMFANALRERFGISIEV